MAHAGARAETADEIGKVLGLTQADANARMGALLGSLRGDKDIELAIANRLWGDRSFQLLPDYQRLTRETYGAELGRVDFGAAEKARVEINGWVETQTRGKIKELLPAGAVGALTRLVLTNAIYFKGKWAVEFDKKETKKAPFFAPGGEKRVALMHRQARFAFAQRDGYRVVSLPYRGGRIVMDIVLPDRREGLPALEKRLRAGVDLTATDETEVNLWVPRFTVSFGTTLRGPLGALGVRAAFDPGSADFSGITAGAREQQLHISEGYHKAFVEVNEEGTEAAAATGLVFTVTSVPPPPAEFRADHPFLYVLRDRSSGLILFMGRLESP